MKPSLQVGQLNSGEFVPLDIGDQKIILNLRA